ncbi:hypothetical protein [Burkholderia oklahomensis]|uniref:hypothetical protein n=1 Tax=Burkholderia oklahomensis TaxID=342113 RepID=UPI0002FCC87B|nr:hypothetical protein [Burkholderia oklahomensis]AOI45369.1 hypothetical protein WI23_05880 [Burkholderia oklahomensis C6786]KUY58761.1 hypothetical protein WI23_17040 [Burkholderia oklahomensis C6786]MBI0358558.1 hypothetical protein [Burkholderia oklahomensis]
MIEIPNEWRRCCKARNDRLCLERARGRSANANTDANADADAMPTRIGVGIRTGALVRDGHA